MALQFDQLNNQLKTNDSTNANASMTLTPAGTGAVLLNGTGNNLLTYSNTFGSWIASNVTLTTGQADPFGATNATLITKTAVGFANVHNSPTPTVLATGITFTYSVYAKANATNFITLLFTGDNGTTANGRITYNLSTQAITNQSSTSLISSSIISVGNGWYRCILSATLTNNTSVQCYLYPDDNAGSANAGSIYIYGSQLEIGTTANAYVPTTSAAIYNAPQLSFSGVAGLGLQSDGSLYVSPAGTGALQAQATTSSVAGGNARGANAVDWQTSRGAAASVASGQYGIVGGGYNNNSTGFASTTAGGYGNATSGTYPIVAGGISNTASNAYAGILGGYSNTAAGYYSLIIGGYSNSGTSGTAVTTQSATMNGTTAVTLAATNANIKVGQLITGTSINSFPSTYVAAISGTSLTLSQAASGSSTSTLSFYTPHGVVVGGGNNQATGSYSFIGGGGDAGTAANRNVASGDWSVVGGGKANQATGNGAVIAGGGTDGITLAGNTSSGPVSGILTGLGNTSSGSYAVVLGGTNNTASGNNSSILSGAYGTTRLLVGNTVFAASNLPLGSIVGSSQGGLLVVARQTTDATPTVLASNTSAASGNNQVILPNNSAYYFRGEIIAGVTGGGNTKGWFIEGVIKRGANAASTALVGTPTVTSNYADVGASTWTIGVTADTTNGGLAVTFTGQAATTIRTVCQIRTTEMTY
jgi:hypothetical protein